MQLVVMVEEESIKVIIEEILPRIVPSGTEFIVIPFQGKGDLMNGIVFKLRGWNRSDARFVIVRDQDENDCHDVKEEVAAQVAKTGKVALIRIVCRELESWYYGDLQAVSEAYGGDYTGYAAKRGYRNPDSIHNVKKRFYVMVPGHQQVSGARRIAPYMEIERNKSRSFHAFVDGVKKVCAEDSLCESRPDGSTVAPI